MIKKEEKKRKLDKLLNGLKSSSDLSSKSDTTLTISKREFIKLAKEVKKIFEKEEHDHEPSISQT